MMRPIQALPRFARAFARDRRGVSAIEFALIAPFLIALYMGLAELSQGMTAQRHASHAASVLGDLITQSDTLPAADVDKMMDAAAIVMRPYPTTSLKVRITSVTADVNGTPKSKWSRGKPGLAAYAYGATVAVPTGLLSVGDNMLVAESAYTYTSPVTTMLPNPLVFSEKFYLKARKGSEVLCTGC